MFTVDQTDRATVLHLAEEMTCISPAVYGGGIRSIRHIINYTLGNDWVEYDKMSSFCESIARKYECDPKKTTVLLTAVWQSWCRWSNDGCSFATAGMGNAAPLYPPVVMDNAECAVAVGTINTVHVLKETLTENALIEAYGIVKMTIADVLRERHHYCVDDDGNRAIAAGTPTDRTAIICSKQREPLHFAGLKTEVGTSLANSTYEALTTVLRDRYD